MGKVLLLFSRVILGKSCRDGKRAHTEGGELLRRRGQKKPPRGPRKSWIDARGAVVGKELRWESALPPGPALPLE